MPIFATYRDMNFEVVLIWLVRKLVMFWPNHNAIKHLSRDKLSLEKAKEVSKAAYESNSENTWKASNAA